MSDTMSRRDRMIPWYFVIFFVALALINGVMVTLAVRTQTGTVTDHPYEKGLAYNRVVEAVEKQAALGWKGDISFTPSGPGKGALAFSLRDQANKPMMCRVTAVIFRPVQAGLDQTITLAADLPGDYKVDIDVPFPGLWEIRIKAESEGEIYQQSKRLVIP